MRASERVKEIHLTSLSGLGASYRFKGFFIVEGLAGDSAGGSTKVNFKGIAFGGLYGGHNVNVEISPKARKKMLDSLKLNDNGLEELLTDVQRRIMQGDMVVEYGKIKPESTDPLGNITG